MQPSLGGDVTDGTAELARRSIAGLRALAAAARAECLNLPFNLCCLGGWSFNVQNHLFLPGGWSENMVWRGHVDSWIVRFFTRLSG